MSFEVMKPGMLTTVQDMGRRSQRKYGVVTAGPMDRFAMRAANALVGNDAKAAVLEMTLTGAELAVLEDSWVAICGADCRPSADGMPVPQWQPVWLRRGAVLRMPYAVAGCRFYLAAAGGFDVEPVMNSRSTYLQAGIGGLQGRALQRGDRLAVGRGEGERLFRRLRQWAGRAKVELAGQAAAALPWQASAAIRPAYADEPALRIVAAAETGLFAADSLERLFRESLEVGARSDRMGYRLRTESGAGLQLRGGVSPTLISAAVAPGTLQVPPDGQPILLMADAQTIGGYPRIGHVISADLPLAAQAKPGSRLCFREVGLREAQELQLLREMDLRLLEAGIRARLCDECNR